MRESILEEFQDDLFNQVNKVYEKHLYSRINIPNDLYHYTTNKGAYGILSSGDIWACDIKFMNDPTEIHYGNSIIEAAIKDYGDNKSEEDVPDIVASLLKEKVGNLESKLMSIEDNYVVCFSEASDLLSQWRSYGDDGKGTCIEFNLSNSENVKSRSADIPFTTRAIIKVIYDEIEQKQLVDEFLFDFGNVCDELQKKYDVNNSNEKQIIKTILDSYLNGAFRILVFFFKHPAYSEEKEWRLIQTRRCLGIPDVRGVFFAPSNEKLKAYIKIRLSTDDKMDVLPISKIVVGPKGHEGNISTYRRLLKAKGYNVGIENTLIFKSSIPYR